jgi:glycosyltransferase involved in cell wall biosynthesis
MTKSPHRICLITPGHISSTPRIVKEAETLATAGYDVHLVSSSHYAPVEALDQSILRRATWHNIRVCTAAGPQAFLRRLRRRWLRRFRPGFETLSLHQALLLNYPGLPQLVDAAVATEADFFHGHCVAGLAAAAQAAACRNVPYGFDAEDFHEAETVEVEQDPFEGAIVRLIMGAYLNGAKLLTAAAPLIAEEYGRCHGVRMEVVLNAFAGRDAPTEPKPPRLVSTTSPAKLYWFSQTIGPGRGLERMLAVMARMRTPTRLQLRGYVSGDHAALLRSVAERAGLVEALEFLPPAAPDEMVRLAAGADLGLSLEEAQPRNRDLCLTNKIFAYLLAGIPQVLSQTTAQVAFAPELGSAALLGVLDGPEELAARLDDFLADANRIRAARHHAWQIARTRYCWEVEKDRFLNGIRHALPAS